MRSFQKPKNILRQHNLRPSKKLGQNFLVNQRVLYKIIGTSDLSANDIVLEVGPGLGVLTVELARHVKRVVAVEKDKKMIEALNEVLKENNVRNVEIICGDILKLQLSSLNLQTYKLIANIPYYLTSPLIRKFLESENSPRAMTLMVQKEVAQRICAKPPRMTLLSVSVQFYATPKIISSVSKESFWPQPKVDSAIIKIVPYRPSSVIAIPSLAREKQSRGCATGLPRPDITSELAMTTKFRDQFFKIVHAGFSHPRKQLANNLSTELKISRQKIENFLERAQLKPSQRAEELTVDNWRILTVLIVENVI